MNETLEPVYSEFSSFLKLINEPILHLSGSKISIVSLAISALVVFIAVRVARFTGRMVSRQLEARAVDSGLRDSLEKFVRYLVVGIGVLFALDNLGISVNSLAAVGAVLMVGIGFGLQNITQNFISGIIILIERPIKVGDIVKVGSFTGRIVDIRVRSTIIQTRDEVTIIIPNSKLVSEEVVNESFSGQRIRQHILVGVAYGSDVAMVTELLCKAASQHPAVLADPPPKAIFEAFGDSSLNFDLRFWSEDIWGLDQVSSDIRTTIDKLFKNAAIQIPFPQRDIHIKSTHS